MNRHHRPRRKVYLPSAAVTLTPARLGADGSPVCWGSDLEGEASPPTGETFVATSSGWGPHLRPPRQRISPMPGEKMGMVRRHHLQMRSLSPSAAAITTPVPCAPTARQSAGDLVERRDRPLVKNSHSISSGSNLTCALRSDGSPVCWGWDRYNQASPPSGEKFTSISSHTGHTCALRADGSPVCWGYDGYGQASPPATVSANMPNSFHTISTGAFHTCALQSDGLSSLLGSGPRQR